MRWNRSYQVQNVEVCRYKHARTIVMSTTTTTTFILKLKILDIENNVVMSIFAKKNILGSRSKSIRFYLYALLRDAAH